MFNFSTQNTYLAQARMRILFFILFACIFFPFFICKHFYIKAYPPIFNITSSFIEFNSTVYCLVPNFTSYDYQFSKKFGIEDHLLDGQNASNITFLAKTRECKHCLYHSPSSYHPNSSEKDICIGSMFNKIVGLYFTVHTLRTTGCKALIFILSDQSVYDQFSMSPFKQSLIDCRCFFINCGKIQKNDYVYITYIQNLYMYQFLSIYGQQFSRCIKFDPYDTIFQTDPFDEHLIPGKLVGYIQEKTFGTSKIDSDWISPYLTKPDDIKKYSNLSVINCGFVAGDVKLLTKYISVILTYANCNIGVEQGLVNYLYYEGIFKKNGIEIFFYPLNKYYVPYCPEPKFIGSYQTHGIYVTLIHHYQVKQELVASIKNACPLDNFSLGQLIPKF